MVCCCRVMHKYVAESYSLKHSHSTDYGGSSSIQINLTLSISEAVALQAAGHSPSWPFEPSRLARPAGTRGHKMDQMNNTQPCSSTSCLLCSDRYYSADLLFLLSLQENKLNPNIVFSPFCPQFIFIKISLHLIITESMCTMSSG